MQLASRPTYARFILVLSITLQIKGSGSGTWQMSMQMQVIFRCKNILIFICNYIYRVDVLMVPCSTSHPEKKYTATICTWHTCLTTREVHVQLQKAHCTICIPSICLYIYLHEGTYMCTKCRCRRTPFQHLKLGGVYAHNYTHAYIHVLRICTATNKRMCTCTFPASCSFFFLLCSEGALRQCKHVCSLRTCCVPRQV